VVGAKLAFLETVEGLGVDYDIWGCLERARGLDSTNVTMLFI
jgi:hypothetical protein